MTSFPEEAGRSIVAFAQERVQPEGPWAAVREPAYTYLARVSACKWTKHQPKKRSRGKKGRRDEGERMCFVHIILIPRLEYAAYFP
jgi:hypothetical protein